MRESGPKRRALARGLRNRSPLIILAAALLAVVALAGLQWFVASGDFTVIPERLMLRIPNDDYVNVSYRVAELKRTPPVGPVVYLFGGSGAMEVMRSENTLAGAVSADTGTNVRVVSLAAHAQSMGETLALIDNLPRGRGLLAIGLSTNRLINGPGSDVAQLSGSPLALTSPHLAAVLAGRTSLKKHLPGLLSGVFDFVLSYLNQRVKGYSVVFFQQPLGLEASTPGWRAFLAAYRRDIAGVMRAYGVPDIDVQPQAGLREVDFGDLFHLVNSGRDKWTPLFARDLAGVLKAAG